MAKKTTTTNQFETFEQFCKMHTDADSTISLETILILWKMHNSNNTNQEKEK
jgi:hypothetical protein